MPDERLTALARLHGVETTLPDRAGKPQTVSARVLKGVLAALGVPAATEAEVARAIADHELGRWREVLPPVLVRRASELPGTIEIRLRTTLDAKRLRWRVQDESGIEEEGAFRPQDLPLLATHDAGGSGLALRRLALPVCPEPGYHRIELCDGEERLAQTVFVVCPDTAYQPDAIAGSSRVWGPAVRLATVRSSRNWGIGDFTDLRILIGQWAARGAGAIGVEALHAALPEHGPGANAHRPSSRLYPDAVYIDVERIEDLREDEEAQALVRSAEFQSRLARLRAADRVDFAGVEALKRTVFGLLHRSFRTRHLSHGTARAGAFRAFRRTQGERLRRHALFQALQEHFQGEDPAVDGWPKWPEPYRNPASEAVASFAEQNRERVEFFEYLQWLTELQWHRAGWRCEEVGVGVGLVGDLPLYVAPGGAESWMDGGLHARAASVGTPPDADHASGRDWGFAPPHPERLREAAYRPFIAVLRANMRHNGALRVKHAAGLARRFWMPAGASPGEGAYVSYPAADLLGIVALESQRNRCLVIAEDLGTLPDAARRAFAEVGLLSCTQLQHQRDVGGGFAAPAAYPAQSLVVASTPEGPTLAAFWEGRDLDARKAQGTFDSDEQRQAEIVRRSQDRAQLLFALEREGLLPPAATVSPLSLPTMTDAFARALHVHLARSPARLLTVRLEDIVGTVEPAAADRPANAWRKLALALEQWPEDTRFIALTDALAQARGQALFPHSRAQDGVRAIVPRATYRLQLNRDFGFHQAAQLVPYLARLGVSHVYCSPYLKARPGSHHGYDIIDHNALNPEIGSREDFEAFVDALKSHGMGQILDMVPNHMGVMGADNLWWLDVLENGPASHYAGFFDIDWDPVSPALKGRVLVPVLGDHYGSLLERGELRIAYEPDAGMFSVHYYEHRFPVDPREYPAVLERVLKAAVGEPVPTPVLDEFASLVTAFRNLPGRDEADPDRRTERSRDKEVHKRRLAKLVAECPPLARAVEAALRGVNGNVEEPASFDTLHALLEAQAFRLAYWRVASDEINYRRFFDINDLAALRMEDEVVFDATHRLVLDLVVSGQIDGLRIDHPDGLYDPAAYFRRLQERVATAWSVSVKEPGERQSLPLYVVLEKISAGYERLPEPWRVHGTTGYRFMNVVNGLFVDGSARAKFDRIYEAFVPEALEFEEVAYQARRVILRTALASELTVLANRLARLAQADRRTRDFTLNTLRQALVEVVACFPVYRTYIADKASADDRRYLDWAVSRARRRSRAADATIFDFVRTSALGEAAGGRGQNAEALAFARKFQQFTAPVTAKGVEDTAFYRYHRLVSLNEVGGDPSLFGFTVSAFHGASQDRAQKWPHTMLATSTHDSKRSEDVRVRIDALSELPAAWRLGVRRWNRLNRSRKRMVEGKRAPSRNDEYLLYQTLVGTWPLGPLADDGLAAFRDRIQTYMTKAVREAKVESSWINANAAYESALSGFIDSLLAKTDGNLFLQDFLPFQRRIAWLGMLNSLSQTLIKLTSPGVPDIYQGNELWELSLVDPDNRRPVDYEMRSVLLAEMQEQLATAAVGTAMHADAVLRDWECGGPKLYITWRALELRREYPRLFAEGDYTPLSAAGERAEHAVAYARRQGEVAVLVVAGRLFGRLVAEPGDLPLGADVWADTSIPTGTLPEGTRPLNVLTGRSVEVVDGRLLMADVFADFPAALLFCEGTPA